MFSCIRTGIVPLNYRNFEALEVVKGGTSIQIDFQSKIYIVKNTMPYFMEPPPEGSVTAVDFNYSIDIGIDRNNLYEKDKHFGHVIFRRTENGKNIGQLSGRIVLTDKSIDYETDPNCDRYFPRQLHKIGLDQFIDRRSELLIYIMHGILPLIDSYAGSANRRKIRVTVPQQLGKELGLLKPRRFSCLGKSRIIADNGRIIVAERTA
jgi:hypothetical protein